MGHNRQPESNPSSSDEEGEEEEEASGSEDEQSGSDDEQSSGSESEQKHEKTLISPSQPPQSTSKSLVQDQSSSENEDSGSETDSDSPPAKYAVADPKIKPISSKPVEKSILDTKVPKKSESGSVSGSKTTPPAKRPAPAIEKDAKKAKSNTVTDDDSKKQLFQRLWSEDDEIAILQGMIDYKNEKNGESPVNDMGAFHEFIKKSLHVDVSRAQLVDKVRRLKKKYVNNAFREKSSREKNGKDRSFSKSHEQKGYELSKLIWGGGGDSNSSVVETKKVQSQKNGNVKGNAVVATTSAVVKSNGVDVKEVFVTKGIDINRFVQYGRNDSPVLDEEIMKGGMELVEESKREELEEKWKELKKQELQLYVKRMELVKQQALVVLEAVNSSDH